MSRKNPIRSIDVSFYDSSTTDPFASVSVHRRGGAFKMYHFGNLEKAVRGVRYGQKLQNLLLKKEVNK